MSIIPHAAGRALEKAYRAGRHGEVLAARIPPAPLRLEHAYRQQAGLSASVPIPHVTQHTGPRARLVPYDIEVSKEKHAPITRYCDAVIADETNARHGPHTIQNALRLPRFGLWGDDAMRVAMNHLMDRWANGSVTTPRMHQVLRTFLLTRPARLRAAEVYGPGELVRAQAGKERLSPLWAEHFQWITMQAVNDAVVEHDYAQAATMLERYMDTMRNYGYYARSQPCHFRSEAHALLCGAMHVLKIRAGQVPPDSHAARAFDAEEYLCQRYVPWASPIDVYALHMSPAASVASTHALPLFELLKRDLVIPTDIASSVQRRLQDMANAHRGISLMIMMNLAPQLTHECTPEQQAIESILHAGSSVLRAQHNDPQVVESVAANVYRIFSRDDVFPHLGFFTGTRLAMGMLADAQTWTDGTLPFTQALGGFGALLRTLHSAGGEAFAAQPEETFALYLDPLHMFTEAHASMLDHARAYVHAAANAGYFTKAAAQNMQHSVQITAPDHSANAVIVHSDGEGA